MSAVNVFSGPQTGLLQSSVIRIAAVGLTQWELNFLQTTVAIAAGGDIGQWRNEPDPTKAQVVIVSAEDRRSAAWLGPDEATGAHRALVITLADPAQLSAANDGTMLQRPILYPSLIALLRRLEVQLRDAALPPAPQVAAAPPAPEPVAAQPLAMAPSPSATPPNPTAVLEAALARKAQRRACFYDDSRLLGLIRRAIAYNEPVEISHPQFATLGVYPQLDAYTSMADPCAHPAVFRAPVHEFRIQLLGTEGISALHVAAPQRPLQRLLYCAALYGSEGRLLAEDKPEDLLELAQIPDLGPLPGAAQLQSIAGALAHGPLSLQELAEHSGMQMDASIDTINALEVIGCLRRVPGKTEPQADSTSPHDSSATSGVDTLRRLRALLHTLLPGSNADH